MPVQLLYLFRDTWKPRSTDHLVLHKGRCELGDHDRYSCFSHETEVPPSELVEKLGESIKNRRRVQEITNDNISSPDRIGVGQKKDGSRSSKNIIGATVEVTRVQIEYSLLFSE